MKNRIVALSLAGVLALGIVGCGQQPETTEPAAETKAEEKTEQVVSQTSWKDAKDAEEAAKGAGLDKFGVFEKLTFNDTTYQDPKFSYADGVAQATYDAGANMLVIRKGASGHKAPLTDRDKTEFATKWSQEYADLDVTLYGPSKGAAVVLTWSDGSADYGVTYQGTGGEEVTLDDEDVTAIVGAIKDANADKKDEAEKSDEKKDDSKQNNNSNNNNNNNNDNNNSGKNPLSESDVEQVIWNNGLGEVQSMMQVQLNDGLWYWEVTTKGSDGSERTYVIDPNGSVTNVDVDSNNSNTGGNPLSEADVEQIIWNNGLGDLQSMMQVQLNDGLWYWEVTTKGSDGAEYSFVIDPNGNVSPV